MMSRILVIIKQCHTVAVRCELSATREEISASFWLSGLSWRQWGLVGQQAVGWAWCLFISRPERNQFWVCRGRHGFREPYCRWVSESLAGIHLAVGFCMMWRAPQKTPQAQAKCGRHPVKKLAPQSSWQNQARAGRPVRCWVDRSLFCDGSPLVVSQRIFRCRFQRWQNKRAQMLLEVHKAYGFSGAQAPKPCFSCCRFFEQAPKCRKTSSNKLYSKSILFTGVDGGPKLDSIWFNPYAVISSFAWHKSDLRCVGPTIAEPESSVFGGCCVNKQLVKAKVRRRGSRGNLKARGGKNRCQRESLDRERLSRQYQTVQLRTSKIHKTRRQAGGLWSNLHVCCFVSTDQLSCLDLSYFIIGVLLRIKFSFWSI